MSKFWYICSVKKILKSKLTGYNYLFGKKVIMKNLLIQFGITGATAMPT